MFIVSNSDYSPINPTGSSNLESCAKDMRLMASTYGFASRDSREYARVYARENLTADGICAFLGSINEYGVDEEDVTVFYYTGHGAMSSDDEYKGALLGVDGAGVTHGEVINYLDSVPGTIVIYLDSCFSGVYTQSGIKFAAGDAALTPDSYNRSIINAVSLGSRSKDAQSKYKIITSSAANQYSYYDEFGFFTQSLCEGMGCAYANGSYSQAELKADSNGDATVSLNEAYIYAKNAVNEIRVQARIIQDVQVWPSNSSFAVYERS
ncbi:MAG: caspase family protein [Clostridia bacterium]|nr:caspase family protein [Clostridia bacterium]